MLNSIKTKLLFLILIILIPMTLLQALRIHTNYIQNLETELDANYEVAEVISMYFMNYLEDVWTGEYGLGVAISANYNLDKEDMKRNMEAFLKHDRVILSYSWVSPEGKIIVSTDRNIKENSFIKEDYYKRIINGENKIISNLFHDSIEGKLILATARAIKKDDELVGSIVGIIDVIKLHEILCITDTSKKSRYTLLDTSGTAVFLNESKYLRYDQRISNANNPALEALKGQVEKTYRFRSQYDGTDRFGISYPIKDIGWAFIVTSSYDQLAGVHRRTMMKDLTLLLLVSMVSLFFAFMLGKQLVASMQKLRSAAEQVSRGDFDVNLEVAACEELEITSQAFNQMSQQINNLIKELEKHHEMKSQFYVMMSHELKTPLNIILGAIQVIDKLDKSNMDEFHSKLNKYLGISRQNSYRLLRLINNLIDLNKIEGNHMMMMLKNCDIVGTIEDITMSVVEYAKMKNLELIFDTVVEEKIMAIDPDKIERIMLNLISNAIKFTNPGGHIAVNIYQSEDSVLISVKDTGIGIPVEMQKNVFNHFVQVDSSLQRKTEGSGIGLSIVQSLVEMHGGSIAINSDYTKGTEFIFELPVTLIAQEDTTDICTSISNVERISIEFSDIY
ncbi:MAG TPA: sensor histidine kinase [Patescibacteria group bacterium]|nr:sensor histidine kinase [Patescibacteria group bacterium]